MGAALYLVDRPAAIGLSQYIDGTVQPLIHERSLADHRRTFGHFFGGAPGHGLKVKASVLFVCGDFHIVAENAHGQISHLVAGSHAGKDIIGQDFFLRFVLLEPDRLRALAESAISRFGKIKHGSSFQRHRAISFDQLHNIIFSAVGQNHPIHFDILCHGGDDR